MILSEVRSYIEKLRLLGAAKTVVVGLSGGADSVALLDVLVRLGYPCLAVHCNFHLRGDESLRDEQHAEAFARSLDVPFLKTDFDTRQFAAEKHLSIEMAARELRYAWFEQIRSRYDAQAIAVAHHRDDSVETFLLNLTRGAGLRGLTGIRPRNGYVVRPLLAVSRADILEYLDSRRLTFVTDSTNLSDAYTRNFIRLNLLPQMEKIAPAVKERIACTTDYLADAEEIYLYVIEEARKKLWTDNRLDIEGLMKYPAPQTILFELLRPYHFSSSVTADIFSSFEKISGKTFYSSTHRLIKDRNFLILSPNKREEAVVYTITLADDMPELPVDLSFNLVDLNKNKDFEIERNRFTAYFDFDKLTFPLTLRRWQKGDCFVPFGMKGRKKLSDYFSDNKFSLADKENCWLLCSGQNIIWIVGERADNRFRLDSSTKCAFVVKFLDKNV